LDEGDIVIVVGVGCGPGMLTEEAIDRIAKATRIYGSKRAVAIVRRHIPSGAEVGLLTDYSNLSSLPADSVLLSTGDPMLAGLGHLGSEVVPGISSMQLAFSRLRLPLTLGVVVDAHGRDHAEAITEAVEALDRGKVPFLLTDPSFDVEAMADMMLERHSDATIALCERLGYPDETITFGRPSCPPKGSSELTVIVIIKGRMQ
jgi:cobalt-precorrin-7 (C5)-methyltransferase